MAAPNRRTSTGIDRRASMRRSIDHQNSEVDDDDYDLEAMGISDGFRPSNSGTTGNNGAMTQTPDNKVPPPRPSSTTKPSAIDSFALRHDGAMGTDLRRDSMSASGSSASRENTVPTRASSISTDTGYVRPESPYRGPTGPSHPYQMYPQESRLARTASMATTTTVPVSERSYAGPSGPTHPYGMYPQNIVEGDNGESSSSSQTATPPIPVGFPGQDNNYQRRLGPDGEEIADIIGPDGHTEQLPPYTQYPDEAFARKTRPAVAVTVPSTPQSSVSPVSSVPVVPGAGGIGLATRNPEFASQENLNSPASRRSIMSDDVSSHQVNTGAVRDAEKPELKRWQKAARRKVCGIIPVWVFFLTAIVFILFGIVLGTVLAILKPKHPKGHGKKYSNDIPAEGVFYTTVMTTTYDATPLTSVPTGIPALPTGNFVVPISSPSLNQATCLQNTAQSNAWSCNIAMAPGPLQITIEAIVSSGPLENNEMILNYGNQTMNSFTYGAQAPTFAQEQVLRLVHDADEVARGPAWWFQMPYDKIVVIRETDLAPSSSKRDGGGGGRPEVGDFGRKGVAQPGEKPWFCFWNGTVLEAFIYPNQTSAYGSKIAAQAALTTTSAYGTGTITGSSSVPTSSGGSGGQSSGQPYWNSYQPPMIPPYGKVIKIEEHRMSSGPQVIPPYCIQKSISPDGSASPILNSAKQPVTVYLNETEATTFVKRVFLDFEERDVILTEREAGGGNKCGCVWLYS